MGKTWILLIALAIFLLFMFLFWLVTHRYIKEEYGMKVWNHWPSKLSYWQSGVLYSVGLTVVTIFVLRWGNILSF